MKNNILLKIILKDLQKLNEKKKSDGMRSVKKGADNNPKVTKMDFLPNKVLNKIAKSKDETLEEAFTRTCKDEIGKAYKISDATFKGIYQQVIKKKRE